MGEGVPAKCSNCSKEPVFHDVQIMPDGSIVEKHACEDCAAELGFVSVESVLGGPETEASTVRSRSCDECGLTFAQFKRVGRLGCPACYDAFERQLMGILDRSQQGGTHHVGKIPRRLLRSRGQSAQEQSRMTDLLEEAKQRAARIKALGDRLKMAIDAEQYEQAARIRDEIRKIGGGPTESEPDASGAGEPA